MKYALLVDVNRCSICFACQVACKDEFVGNSYPPYSYPQPDREQEWIKVSEVEKGKYPYVKVYPVPLLCMHCNQAPCIDACPVPDCIYKTESGAVVINPAKCTGCKSCMKACPYGMIFFNDDTNICQKCTFCMHRLEEGKEPACVDACPSGVLFFGKESEVLAEAKKRGASLLHPEYKTKPRVYYIGLPLISLAGHLIGERSLMDVPDANIAVTDTKTGKSVTCTSNIAGNFLVKDLKMNNVYSVKIECKGYSSKVLDNVHLDVDYKHLGNIKLVKP